MKETVQNLVSVIMTNYNTPEEYLREAIDSILAQTYSIFEFIIIDDCSTDNSLQVLRSYSDKRIQIFRNEENMGLTKSLNKALKIAKGQFIARMDSDDISEPERFEKQVMFLRKHKNVIACSTWAKLIGDWKEQDYSHDTICKIISDRETHRIMLLFGNHPNLVHPATMFNNNLLLKYNILYNENYIYAQDYRMWVECTKYADLAIIPEFLIQYRVTPQSITSSKKRTQADCADQIRREQLGWLGLELNNYHLRLCQSVRDYDIEYLNWIKTLLLANAEKKVFDQKAMEDFLMKRWAEKTYYGLYKSSGIEKLKVLFRLPLRYWSELIKMRKSRKKKLSEGGTE